MTRYFWPILALLMFTGLIFGQAPPPLTQTERIALSAVQKEFQRINTEQQEATKALRAIEEDIVKEHPGYVLDEANMTLKKVESKK
jgi:hypothetical protein